MKLILIDIDSDAGDAASDEVSGEVILYQYTAYFLISPVNIIRPLYRNLVRPSVQLFLNGEGNDLRQDKLAACFQKSRIEDKTEKQILSFVRFPGVATLAFAGCLKFGCNCSQFSNGFLARI